MDHTSQQAYAQEAYAQEAYLARSAQNSLSAPRPVTEMDELISSLSKSLQSIRHRVSDVSLRVAGSSPPTANKAEVSRVAQTYGDHLRDTLQTVSEIDDLLSRIEGKV